MHVFMITQSLICIYDYKTAAVANILSVCYSVVSINQVAVDSGTNSFYAGTKGQ